MDPTSYLVNIGLYRFTDIGEEWRLVAYLGTELPNNGSIEVTIPNTVVFPGVTVVAIAVEPAVTAQRQLADNPLGLRARIWGLIGYFVAPFPLNGFCDQWYSRQPADIGLTLLTQVEPCPCDERQADRDKGFIWDRTSATQTFHPGASDCYRQVVTNRYVCLVAVIALYHQTFSMKCVPALLMQKLPCRLFFLYFFQR